MAETKTMKTAAYICSGCGIGDKLDTKQLAKVAQREGKMALVREHAFLCSEEGVQQIRQDIAGEDVTHVMIGACSRRTKTEAFHFPEAAVARANLREGVLWIVAEGDAHDEVRQEMADDYVRMGCAELKKMKLPAGNPDAATNRRILVVGGGMSGLTAAIGAADTGYDVVGAAARFLWNGLAFVVNSALRMFGGVAAAFAESIGLRRRSRTETALNCVSLRLSLIHTSKPTRPY